LTQACEVCLQAVDQEKLGCRRHVLSLGENETGHNNNSEAAVAARSVLAQMLRRECIL